MRADIVALAVELSRIVRREEDVEQVVIADDIGFEGHANGFRMAGVPSADLLISGIGDVAARVAAFDLRHAHDVVEHGFGAPKHPPANIATCSAMTRSFCWSGRNRYAYILW